MGHYSDCYDFDDFISNLHKLRHWRLQNKALEDTMRQFSNNKESKIREKLQEALFWHTYEKPALDEWECNHYGYDYNTLEKKE